MRKVRDHRAVNTEKKLEEENSEKDQTDRL